MAVARARGGASAGSGRSRASARGRGRPAPNPGASSLFGRDHELAELAGLLDEARLITLTGAPGIGKSRLAVEVAGGVRERFAAGAHVVELAPVTRPVGVARALATALKVDEVAGERLTDTLVARLSKRRLLLVLDNCEHLLGACATLVEALLAGCPELRILATSREPLGLAGETVWQVPPLPVPRAEDDSLELVEGVAAVRLFVEHAGAVEPSFRLNPYVAPAVAEICRRLDGIPLAIELAAARVESLTTEEIAARLSDRFNLLTDAATSGLARHETLQAALDLSHELLSEPERALLRRLSVFAGGFELEAVEAICPGGELEAGEVGELLTSLTVKSLVDRSVLAPPSYHLLETIRAYASERLADAGESAGTRRAHARFYLALAERADPELTGPGQERWFERLDAERANLCVALEWSLSHGETEQALRLAGALVLFWRVRGYFSEGRELLDASIPASRGAPVELRARALWGSGFMTMMVGEINAATPLLERSVALFREADDHQGLARALMILGNCMQFRDRLKAISLLEESAAEARVGKDSWCLAHALAMTGFEYKSRNDLPAARTLFKECLEVSRAAQDGQGLRWGLMGLGEVALRQGDFRLAESLLEEAMAVTDKLGEDYGRATILKLLGALANERGDFIVARELLTDAMVLFRKVGHSLVTGELLGGLAIAAHGEGKRSLARELYRDSLAQFRGGGGTPSPALHGLAMLAVDERKVGVAQRLLEEALELAREHGNKGGEAEALYGLGVLAHVAGEIERATTLHSEALEIFSKIGTATWSVASLEALGRLAVEGGRRRQGARLLVAAKVLRERNGYVRGPLQSSPRDGDRALLEERLCAQERASAAGLSLEQAVDEALSGATGQAAEDRWGSLTEREREVAALVAEGLTNREIAERLFVTHGTARNHVSHILAKLGVAGRRQLRQEVKNLQRRSSGIGPRAAVRGREPRRGHGKPVNA